MKTPRIILHFIQKLDLHSAKVSLALILGYLITDKLYFPMAGLWVLVTIVMVMIDSHTVGGFVQKAYLRFVGTILGATVAIFTCVLVDEDPVIIVIDFLVFGYLFAWLANRRDDYAPVGSMALVTLILILLIPQPTLYTAGSRMLEITLGIFIAYVVVRGIFPARADKAFREEFADNVMNLTELLQTVVLWRKRRADSDDAGNLDKKIITSFVKQRELIKQAAREHHAGKNHHRFYASAIEQQRVCYRCIYFLEQSLSDRAVLAVVSHRSFVELTLKLIDILKHCATRESDDQQLLMARQKWRTFWTYLKERDTHLTSHQDMGVAAVAYALEQLLLAAECLHELLRAPQSEQKIAKID